MEIFNIKWNRDRFNYENISKVLNSSWFLKSTEFTLVSNIVIPILTIMLELAGDITISFISKIQIFGQPIEIFLSKLFQTKLHLHLSFFPSSTWKISNRNVWPSILNFSKNNCKLHLVPNSKKNKINKIKYMHMLLLR